jgi:hypothetical protein
MQDSHETPSLFEVMDPETIRRLMADSFKRESNFLARKFDLKIQLTITDVDLDVAMDI